MARRGLLTAGGRADIGERLLGAKLQMLSGAGNRRPGMALSILTGRSGERLAVEEPFTSEPAAVAQVESAPAVTVVAHSRPHLLPRTVYLTESHLRDVEAIIGALQPAWSRRLTRSAVLRRAIEHLRATVEADPAESLLEGV